MEAIKKIPYGMTDFARIVKDHYYYVDKSHYIALIEQQTSFFFFVRPRRFGKSLFLNMLGLYYDCNCRDEFDELFGSLYIGQHPTPERNKYLVLTLNFSSVCGGPEEIQKEFDKYCAIRIASFASTYEHLFGKEVVKDSKEQRIAGDSANSMLSYLCAEAQQRGLKIYLILDEYDNFSNNILVDHGNSLYRGITHGTGFFRGFLKVIKDYSSNTIERIYITGVSPVTMDDLTSGFNIADNYSSSPRFNNMIGFNEQEVRQMIDYYKSRIDLPHSTDELIGIMKPWYDNYCFALECIDEPPMYNSDMVLYFMNRYMEVNNMPRNMLDSNIRTDYNKLRHLIHIDKSFGENASVVREVLDKGYTIGMIADTFPAEDIIKPENFKSLLYYYGMLTIGGTAGPMARLTIPNQTVREQLYNYMINIYRQASDIDLDAAKLNILMYEMAYEGDWRPYFDHIVERLNNQSTIREFIEGEAHVKAFILAYLGFNSYYVARPEYESNKGYADIFLQPRLPQLPDMKYSYCIEVKYAKRDAPDSVINQLLEEARTQLKQYSSNGWIHHDKGTTELKCLALVFHGWKLAKVEEININA